MTTLLLAFNTLCMDFIDKILAVSRNIVNQLFDLYGEEFKKLTQKELEHWEVNLRQRINDRADEFVNKLVTQALLTQKEELIGEIMGKMPKETLKADFCTGGRFGDMWTDCCGQGESDGFNLALSQIQNLLKSYKQSL